ncbi:MAG: hypothetical protein E7523_10575 [Ruminococcaceae bacterium]|nr:hypothetical protein [Oscillospiraceae bacterium]
MKKTNKTLRKVISIVSVAVLLCTATPVHGFVGTTAEPVFAQQAKATVVFDDSDIVESGACGTGVTYEIDGNDTIRIAGSGKMTVRNWSTDIRNAIIGDGVKNIIDRAFIGCEDLESVQLGKSVREIGDSAFENCLSLESIVFPDSLESIGSYAFLRSGLSDVIRLPSNVEDIGTGAFLFCMPTAFEVAQDNTDYSAKNGILYNKNQTVLLYYPAGSTATSFTVPSTVRCISESAFQYSYNLEEVVMSDSVTMLGAGAFLNCTALEEVTISGNLLSVAEVAFSGCSSLTSVNIPEGVREIADSAFYHCPSLESVSFPTGITTIAADAFGDCESLKNVSYGGTQQQWEDVSIADGNDMLTNASMTFGTVVTVLDAGSCGENVRWQLETDGTLTISGSGPMEDYAYKSSPLYEHTDRITSVVIADGITTIGNYLFEYCGNLASVTIPDSVKRIGEYAFDECVALRMNSIPAGVEEIGYGAFFGCDSLTNITIHAGVKKIEDSAFAMCQQLHTIHVDSKNENYQSADGILYDKGINTILFYPLSRSGSSFSIPDSVEIIGDWAFGGAFELQTVDIPDSVTEIGFGAFQNAGKLKNIVIPASVTTIEAYSIAGCRNLTTVTFEKGSRISLIEEGAFSTVPSLRTVYFGGSQTAWNAIEIEDENNALLNATIYFDSEAAECTHTWDNGVVTTQPTATSDGVRTYTCTKCGAKRTQTIDRLQKQWSKNTQYSFSNSSAHFTTDRYTILDSDFEILSNYIRQYYEADYAQQLINAIADYVSNEDWGGSCHGMALTSLLDYHGKIEMENYDPDADTLYEIDSPRNNEKVQSAVNYYYLTQFLGFLNDNYYAYYQNSDANWTEGLITLVRHTQKTQLVLFGYWFASGGHSIVIKGYAGKDKDGNHILTAYDNRFPEQDVQVVVSADYSSCTVKTPYANEETFAIDMYMSLEDFDMVDIDGPANNGVINFEKQAKTAATTDISVVVNGDMTIRNKENEFIRIANGKVESTMNVINTRMIVSATADGNPAPVRLIFTVSESEHFSFTSDSDELIANIRTKDSYAGISATDAYAATISTKNGISVSGSDAEYTIHQSVGNDDAGFDMMCVKGVSTGSTVVNYEDGFAFVSGSKESFTVGKYTGIDYEENTFNTKTGSATVKMESTFILGDVNRDRNISASDARLALRASVGLETLTPAQTAAADATGDGILAAGDARLILRWSVGLLEDR